MTVTEVPLADDPTSGVLHFDESGFNNMKLGDLINTPDEDYELLSIREDDRVMMVDHQIKEISTVTKSDIKSVLEKDWARTWSILHREIVPVSVNATTKSLLLYFYAAEMDEVSTDDRVLVTSWILNNQVPPETDSQPDETSLHMNFEDIQKDIVDGKSCFEALYETVDEDVTQIVRLSAHIAEYNADSLFGLQHEPTYTDELKQSLDRESVSISDMSSLAEKIYS